MKIAGVDFPQPILNALRDKRLVVFAGAGVLMGPPANLPNFWRLAERVAEGTGKSINASETEDWFLGQLKDDGVNVHERAAEVLQQNAPKPTALHKNLLRIFSESEEVRVVTTNFDELFEQVAFEVFSDHPKLYQAPALPLGNRFRGIVHLHGCVDEPNEMVLTHRDFGRAYLTESGGWARRFLIDLFTNYTVLFVGYSHNDRIMTYLTPSLPSEEAQKRFALIGNQSDDSTHWRRMGIEPIPFHQADAKDFSGLDKAIARLADWMRRGLGDWRTMISEIARGKPPTFDDDSASIIEHALATPELTRFFTDAAEYPEWIGWLDRRGHLKCLFDDGKLDEQHRALAYWLAKRFAVKHSDELFSVIERNGGHLNSELWLALVRELRPSNGVQMDAQMVSKWAHFLMSRVPSHINDSMMSGLSHFAKTCAKVGAFQNLLQVYDIMTTVQHQVRPGYESDATQDLQYHIEELWKECLKPHLSDMAYPLLERTTMRLEERHSWLTAWGEGNKTWDIDNFRRSAIEPHQQDSDRFLSNIDILTNIARNCLERLVGNDPVAAGLWCDRFIVSDAPLLRRLSVHALSAREDMSSDDKIAWLLEHSDVNETAAHHEIFRAVARAYPLSGEQQRTALIRAISKHQVPENEYYDSDALSAYHRFTWFHWLHTEAPDCSIAQRALDAVRKKHPEFEPREHPDFLRWVSPVCPVTSPWTVEELLTKPASEVLPNLLAYQPTVQQRFEGQDRLAMLSAIGEAAEGKPSWGLDLADAMVARAEWDTDLWPEVIRAWRSEILDHGDVQRVLAHLSSSELQRRYPLEIANVLTELVRNTISAEATELLAQANQIAIVLRPYAAAENSPQMSASVDGVQQYVNWLGKALEHTSGHLALFWVHSMDLWRKQKDSPQRLNADYRNALDVIVNEQGDTGKFGRTVLASQFSFLLTVDENWTLENLLPLFDIDHDDFQCAWDGFLTWGRLSFPAAEQLRQKFIDALPRIRDFDDYRLKRFVEYYTGALTLFINDANDDWIVKFFEHANTDARGQFALGIYLRLRNLDETAQQEWWDIWLKEYWHNRIQGVPVSLNDAEITRMLEWTINLPGVFPEAVEVATKMRKISMRRSPILYDIDKRNLLEQHPTDMAKLLIHLEQCDTGPWFSSETWDVVDKLLSQNLPSDLEKGLRDLIIKHR